MRKDCVTELARRTATLLLLVTAAVETFVDLRNPKWLNGLAWAGLAAAIYVLLPRPKIPEGALRYDPLPSTIGPDLVGFLLGIAFFSLPLLVIGSEPSLHGVWLIPLMFWPLGLFALAILYIAARYACSWVILRDHGLLIGGLGATIDLPYEDIVKVAPAEGRLPGWVGWALMTFGDLRGAGVALMHAGRAAHYLQFERKSGRPIRFSVDAFPHLRRVIAALKRAGVPLDFG